MGRTQPLGASRAEAGCQHSLAQVCVGIDNAMLQFLLCTWEQGQPPFMFSLAVLISAHRVNICLQARLGHAGWSQAQE